MDVCAKPKRSESYSQLLNARVLIFERRPLSRNLIYTGLIERLGSWQRTV